MTRPKEQLMQDDMRVRIAEPRDIAAIAEMNMAMAWETEQTRLSENTLVRGIQAVLGNPGHGFYVVAESNDQVVGCLMITFEWSDWRCGQFWWIQSLYVRPASRRQGVFRKLHEFVKTEASRRPDVCGIRLYVEHSNETAQRAYQQIGMHPRSYQMYEQMLPR
jgi:ribosomal protein S18 acetylase RimI-like enzyme